MTDSFDPYRKWLGIPPQEQPPHHYRLLGIGLFESDPDVIEAAADRQMAHVQTYKNGPHAALTQQLLNELAAARLCLLSETRKAPYDAALRTQLAAGRTPPPPPVRAAPPPPLPKAVTAAPVVPSSTIDVVAPSTSRYVRQRKQSQVAQWSLVGLSFLVVVLGAAGAWWWNTRQEITAHPAIPPGTGALAGADIQDSNTDDGGSEDSGLDENTGHSKFFPGEKTNPVSHVPPSPPESPSSLSGPSLEEVRKFAGHEGAVTAIGVSPDGKTLVSGGLDGTVRIWNVASMQQRHVLRDHEKPVLALAINADGDRVLSAGEDQNLRYWNLTTGKLVRTMPVSARRVNAVAFLPDGRHAFSAGDEPGEQAIVMWDVETGREIDRETGLPAAVLALAVSADGKRLACSMADGSTRIWTQTSADKLYIDFEDHRYSGFKHPDGIANHCLAFSPDGTHLLAGSRDGGAHLWDLEQGMEVGAFAGHKTPLRAVCFSADGKLVLTAAGSSHPLRPRAVRRAAARQRRPTMPRTARSASGTLPPGRSSLGSKGTTAAYWRQRSALALAWASRPASMAPFASGV